MERCAVIIARVGSLWIFNDSTDMRAESWEFNDNEWMDREGDMG